MPDWAIGLLGFGLLFGFMLAGTPIAFGFALSGFIGYLLLGQPQGGLVNLGLIPYSSSASYVLASIPLFVFMGFLAAETGISQSLYSAGEKWFGHLRGGLAIATTGACTGFAACTGSSAASAATMASIAVPEMRKYGYSPSLATGCVAAGGTLGILIPPSTGFILYGFLTGESIGRLFIAGIFPGLLIALLYILTIFIMVKRRPQMAPPSNLSYTMKEKLKSLPPIWPMLLLFGMILGGLYFGIFTATEAGGIGAFMALFICLSLRRLTWSKLVSALQQTTLTTCMIFALIIGAMIFSTFIANSGLAAIFMRWVVDLPLPAYGILLVLLSMYIVLGCIMETLSMILLTMPIVFPVIQALGFDPIWFGVLAVLMMEIGTITPPVGLNVFVVHGTVGDVPLQSIFRGVIPFVAAHIIGVLILIAIPQISLLLPSLMYE